MSKTSMDINSWELENKAFKVFENTDLGQTLMKICILKNFKCFIFFFFFQIFNKIFEKIYNN